jgi:hypothetical protein
MYKLLSSCVIRLLIAAVCYGLPMNAVADDAGKIKLGYSQRIRIETNDNVTNLDNDAGAGQSCLRNRMSFMLQYFPKNHFALTAKLTDEFRYYFVPETRKFNFDEVFFDFLNLKIDSIAGYPIDLILGRQNISLGEGFLVMEGGPLDGARSIYFNAALANWFINPKSKVSLIYVYQPKEDNILPIINNQHKQMIEQPEQALITYYSGAIKTVKVEGYFIWNNIKTSGKAKSSRIYCPGIRFQIPLVARFSMTGEAAVQFGEWGGNDRLAPGGYLYTEYRTGWPRLFPKTMTIGGIYLSGDDRSTHNYEGWDPIFGRWPKWSDSYRYTLTREKGVAYWTNLASIFAKTSVEIIPDLTFSFDYHHLMAPAHGDSLAAFPGGKGRNRGDLFMGRLIYKMNAHLSGHVVWESFDPGSFYFGGADSYAWMRMELMLTF